MKLLNIFILTFILYATSYGVAAEELRQVSLDEDELLLVSAFLDSTKISHNVDAYTVEDKMLIAIEPLFDALKLRYQLQTSKLRVWKNDVLHEFNFGKQKLASSATANLTDIPLWGDDGYYLFVDTDILSVLFDIKIIFNKSKLFIELKTGDYKFPVTIISELANKRARQKYFVAGSERKIIDETPITIADNYRFITMPQGEIYTSLSLDNQSQKNSTNVHLVSDFLYHSAALNLRVAKGDDLSGGLRLSRYKTEPDKLILGAFDHYSIGDVSSLYGGGLLPTATGAGVSFFRGPDNYRRENTQITLEQFTNPGWEAELFHNSRFVTSQTVPETGLLIFENVELGYGNNNFEIKLYGPYGEEEFIKKSYPLRANPLEEGNMAYGMYLIDTSRTVFDNERTENSLNFEDYGFSYDYGITDRWQLGVGMQNLSGNNLNLASNTQVVSIKNNISFPGLLFENEFSLSSNSDFAQVTSISGNAFNDATFNLVYKSLKGTDLSSSITTEGINHDISLGYFNSIGNMPVRTTIAYLKNDVLSRTFLSNNLSYSIDKVRLSHTLTYTGIEQLGFVDDADKKRDDVVGSFGITGNLYPNFRLSANLVYIPGESDFISDSSNLTAQLKLQDPYDFYHYFTANYRPLTDTSSIWQVSHRLAFETKNYRLALDSSYQENDNWSFTLRFNFFFGYDYHNNRALTSSVFSSNSATLNVHSYLDRQMNGVPDVLDYDLAGVSFTGNPDWEGIVSGETGKVILPDVPTESSFRFQAHWLNGAESINQDYAIFTHPGARVDVNMPFYLKTELAGYVYRLVNKDELPVRNLTVRLVDQNNKLVKEQKTDPEGYYEFINMEPNRYKVLITPEILREKSLTGQVSGYNIVTPNVGGFSELPTIFLRRVEDDEDRDNEAVIPLSLLDEEQELLIWDDDIEKRQNYFTLPTKEKIKAKHSLDDLGEFNPKDINEQDNDKLVEQGLNSNLAIAPNDKESNYYTLQLGAFLNQALAQNKVDQYSNNTQRPFVLANKNKNHQLIYRVYLGQLLSESEIVLFAAAYGLDSSDYMIKKLKVNELNSELFSTKIIDKKMGVDEKFDQNRLDSENVRVTPLKREEQKGQFNNKLWVIQFYANQSPIQAGSATDFAGIGDLYMAQKTHKKTGDIWYCLISEGFSSKALAKEVLQKENVSGWVTLSAQYSNINSLK